MRLILLIILALGSEVLASSSSTTVYQSVYVKFVPTSFQVIIANDSGGVQQYPAHGVLTGSVRWNEGAQEYLVGARVPTSVLDVGGSQVAFTFFMFGNKERFAATPVAVWSRETLNRNSVDANDINSAIRELSGFLDEATRGRADVEQKLEPLREQASAIAGVEKIIEHKLMLQRGQARYQALINEVERLKRLVDSGRAASEPPELYQQIKELSANLNETAKATAMADRLNQRRRKAALSSLETRLSLVREMERYDREQLAKEILALRAKRRQLEAKVGGAAGRERDF